MQMPPANVTPPLAALPPYMFPPEFYPLAPPQPFFGGPVERMPPVDGHVGPTTAALNQIINDQLAFAVYNMNVENNANNNAFMAP